MPTRTSSDRKAATASGSASGSAPGSAPGARAPTPRIVTLTLAALVVGLGLLWLGLLFADFREGAWVDGSWVFEEGAWAIDLDAYLQASRRIGETGSPYAAELIAGEFEPGPAELYYYAPPLSIALIPLADLSLADSSAIWWAVRIVALLAACVLMPVSVPLRAAAFAVLALSLPGLKDSIIGNVSLLLVLPMAIAWRWLDRPIGSLVMAAAISVRPSLGIFFFWQLLRRQWGPAAWTAIGGVGLVLVAWPFVGLEGHLDFVAVLRNLNIPASEASENRALGSLLESAGLGSTGAMLGRIASLLVSGAALLLSLRREREVGYMVVLCASLLVVPLLWDHYLATLIVPAAFLAQRLWLPLILLPLLSWLPIASPILVVATMLMALLVRQEGRPAQAQPAGVPA